MSDAKPEASAPVVTRQQRVEALILCGWSERAAASLAFERGFSSDLTHDQLASAMRTLNAIATAEARGVARERKEVVADIDAFLAETIDGDDGEELPEELEREWVESLRDNIARGWRHPDAGEHIAKEAGRE